MDKKFEIKKIRKKIDYLDRKISKCLIKRFDLVKKIGKIKRLKGIYVKDTRREKEVLKNISLNSLKYKKEISEIYKNIIKKSRNLQR